MHARHFPSGENSIVSGLNSAWDLEKKKISTIIFGPFSSYLIRIFFLSYSKLAFILLMIIRLFNLIFYFYLFLSLIIMLLIFVLFFFQTFIHSFSLCFLSSLLFSVDDFTCNSPNYSGLSSIASPSWSSASRSWKYQSTYSVFYW